MKPTPPPKKRTKKARHYHVAGKDREYVITNLALLLRAGVPLGQGLQSLIDTTRSSGLKKALRQMQNDIEEGMSLGTTLQRSGLASEQTLALVRLGEESGNLIENLHVAATQEEKQRVFRAKVKSALMYPSFVLSLTVIVGLGVAWFLLPRLADTFSNLNVKLPLISQIFINFGLFLKTNGIWAVPAAIIGMLLLGYIIFGAPKTKVAGQALLLRTPGISRLMREVEIARFGYLLGTLLNAGLTMTQSLELLQHATALRPYQQLYKQLEKGFDEGYNFRASFGRLKKTGRQLPPAIQQMIIAGESSGALPETLRSIGDIYEEKANISTQNLEAIIEPVLLIIVWLGVMLVAVAVILPIYGLVGGLGSV